MPIGASATVRQARTYPGRVPTRRAYGEAPERPWTIRLVLALLVLSILAYVIGAVVSIVLVAEPAERQLLLGASVSDWFWILSALLFSAVAIVLLLVLRAAAGGDRGAGIAVSLLGLLGIGFALMSITHGYGWAVLVISLGILALNQAPASQAWYRA